MKMAGLTIVITIDSCMKHIRPMQRTLNVNITIIIIDEGLLARKCILLISLMLFIADTIRRRSTSVQGTKIKMQVARLSYQREERIRPVNLFL